MPRGTSYRAVPFVSPCGPGGRLASHWQRLTRPSHTLRLTLDDDAHRTGGAFNDLHCPVHIDGVEIDHLGLSDLLDLRLGDRTDLLFVRFSGALSPPVRPDATAPRPVGSW